MKWIKAGERLPGKDGNYYAKDLEDIRFILAIRGGKIASYRKAIEWLDESVSDGEKDKEIERLRGLIYQAWQQAIINCEAENGAQEDILEYVSWQQFKTANNL